jgi:hypothetical protein
MGGGVDRVGLCGGVGGGGPGSVDEMGVGGGYVDMYVQNMTVSHNR